MPGTALFEKPRWLRDLLRFLPLKSQFVLSGNIRDLQACEVVPGTVTAQSFNQTLGDALLDAGYAQVLAWDPLAGFRVLGRPGSEARATPQVLLDLGLTPVDGAAPAGIDLLGATLQRLVNRSGEPIALIVDFASRLAVRNDALSAAEHQLFTQALVLSHQARSRPAGEQRKPLDLPVPFWPIRAWLRICLGCTSAGAPSPGSKCVAKLMSRSRRLRKAGMLIRSSCISGAHRVGWLFTHFGGGRLQNPTAGHFSFQLRVKGIDFTTKALPQIFRAHLAIVAGQGSGQRCLSFDIRRCSQAQRSDQFGLRGFHRFLFLFDGDTGETRNNGTSKER